MATQICDVRDDYIVMLASAENYVIVSETRAYPG